MIIMDKLTCDFVTECFDSKWAKSKPIGLFVLKIIKTTQERRDLTQ